MASKNFSNNPSGIIYPMDKAKIRRILGIIILLVSLVILLWGLWPLANEVRTVPVAPGDMQLPESWLPVWLVVG